MAYYNQAMKLRQYEDDEKCVHLYELGVKDGETDCMNVLAYCYEHGLGVKKNEQLAFENYYRAATLGDMKAQMKLGVLYHQGNSVIGKDETLSFAWYKQAAMQNEPTAVFEVAKRYQHKKI